MRTYTKYLLAIAGLAGLVVAPLSFAFTGHDRVALTEVSALHESGVPYPNSNRKMKLRCMKEIAPALGSVMSFHYKIQPKTLYESAIIHFKGIKQNAVLMAVTDNYCFMDLVPVKGRTGVFHHIRFCVNGNNQLVSASATLSENAHQCKLSWAN